VQLFDVTTVALERALAGAALRHEVLSANIANANTPGYHRADVDFHSVLARALSGAATPESVEDVTFTAAIDGSGPVRYDGSSVDPEREMASLAENGLEYQAIVATLRARMRMLETAIGGRV